MVTWVTFAATNSSLVQYWLHGADPSANTTAVGSSKTFVDHGMEKVVRYIHRVKIAATDPHQEYGTFQNLISIRNSYCLLAMAAVHSCGYVDSL